MDQGFVGRVEMLEGGATLEVDQAYLETVIPKLDAKVMVVRGEQRGRQASVSRVDIENMSVEVRL